MRWIDDGAARDLVGKLLIFRLTARGLCRPRLRSAATETISRRMSSTIQRRCRGGKSGMEGEMPADDANGMDERELVGIAARLLARLVHQLAQREMHQEQAIEFLFDQIDPMAAQDQAFAGQPHFELAKDPLVFPSLMVKRCQFRRR